MHIVEDGACCSTFELVDLDVNTYSIASNQLVYNTSVSTIANDEGSVYSLRLSLAHLRSQCFVDLGSVTLDVFRGCEPY